MSNQLESLETYHKIADRLIATFGQPWMHDDKYKSILITNLVKSDQEYKNNMGTSLATYRFGGWKFAKMKMFQLKKREQYTVSLNMTLAGKNSEYTKNDDLYSVLPSNEPEPIEVAIAQEDMIDKEKFIDSILTHPELTEIEKVYLRMIYKNGLSHTVIAEKLGVTKQAVSFTEQKALRKLRGIYNVEKSK